MEGLDLPVVIAVSGFGGRNQKIDRRLGIIAAQHGAADRKEFKGTPLVKTRISSGRVNNHPAVRAITGTTTPKPTTSSVRAWVKRW